MAIILAIKEVLLLQFAAGSGAEVGQHWVGIILIFATVCCEASYTLMGKALTKTYSPEEIFGQSALVAMLCFIPIFIWQWPQVRFKEVKASDWINLSA